MKKNRTERVLKVSTLSFAKKHVIGFVELELRCAFKKMETEMRKKLALGGIKLQSDFMFTFHLEFEKIMGIVLSNLGEEPSPLRGSFVP